MKLEIDLVPATSWYKNLRDLLPRSVWDRTRVKAYADSGYRCAICGAKAKLNCHEIWEYDDEKHIQKLKGFIALCHLCHDVKHFGRTQIVAQQRRDYEYIEQVILHFAKVNNCNRDEFTKHQKKAFEQWREWSLQEWQIDFGAYASSLARRRG